MRTFEIKNAQVALDNEFTGKPILVYGEIHEGDKLIGSHTSSDFHWLRVDLEQKVKDLGITNYKINGI